MPYSVINPQFYLNCDHVQPKPARTRQPWRRLLISEFELRQLEELKSALDDGYRARYASTTNVPSWEIFSKIRT